MATRDTEGRREIEAAKQRLSAAKSHVTFLSKTLATAQASEDAAKKAWKKAKKNKDDIQAQAADSKTKLSEAKKFLAEAEKRWEVITIDDEDDGPQKTIKGKEYRCLRRDKEIVIIMRLLQYLIRRPAIQSVGLAKQLLSILLFKDVVHQQ